MEEGILFDYHYEEEAERYAFFRIPKALYIEPMFKELSDGAKVFYGQLLDLMSLSRKNGWIDKDGRVFVRCSIDRVKEIMNCSNDKAVKLLKELDIVSGVGLIEKVKMGQGKATVIYVKSFVVMKNRSIEKPSKTKEVDEENPDSDKQNTSTPKTRIQELRKTEFKDSEKQNSSTPENGIQEFQEAEFKVSDKQNTRNPENGILVFQKTERNNTYINKTDSIKPYPINPSDNETDEMDEIRIYTEIIKENISYDTLMERSSFGEREDIDEIVELMVEVICVKRKMVKISGAEYPYDLVKGKMLKVNIFHIEYVLECLHKTTTEIRNIKAYLLTTIYNAPNTIKNYYRAAVNHDMYGGALNND